MIFVPESPGILQYLAIIGNPVEKTNHIKTLKIPLPDALYFEFAVLNLKYLL